MVLAVAAEYDLACWQLDYNIAFLNTKLEEEIYVKMAPGYEEFDSNRTRMVMRLHKSLYGLRQPKPLAGHCQRRSILGEDMNDLGNIKWKLMRRFSMNNKGDVSLVLGMEGACDHEKKAVSITQESYTYQVPVGAMRDGKMQSGVYPWGGAGTFT